MIEGCARFAELQPPGLLRYLVLRWFWMTWGLEVPDSQVPKVELPKVVRHFGFRSLQI